MAPPVNSSAYNVDWIWLGSANVNVCNDLRWFTKYKSFSTPIRIGASWVDASSVKGLGQGEVQLECKVRLSGEGRAPRTRTLVLEDVVYVPESSINVFATNGYRVDLNGGRIYHPQTGERVAILDHVRLWKLLLKGQQVGRSSLRRGESTPLYFTARAIPSPSHDARHLNGTSLGAESPSSDITPKELAVATKQVSGQISSHVRLASFTPRYNALQKSWLRRHYGSEYKFLQAHGLKIWNEDDRDEGKLLVEEYMFDDLLRAWHLVTGLKRENSVVVDCGKSLVGHD